jgi:hypothetical protein
MFSRLKGLGTSSSHAGGSSSEAAAAAAGHILSLTSSGPADFHGQREAFLIDTMNCRKHSLIIEARQPFLIDTIIDTMDC